MSTLPEGFFDRVAELRRHITAGMQGGLAMIQELDLSLTEALAMFHLSDRGPATVGQLQLGVGRSQAATSHLVEQLEQRGLVRRKPDPADRRRRVVELTKKGRAAMRRIEQLRRAALETALAPVPAEVLERYDAVMQEMLAALPR